MPEMESRSAGRLTSWPEKSLMRTGLTVFFGCALLTVIGCMPATAGPSFSTAASVVASSGCINQSVNGTTSASAGTPAPLPQTCPDGNSIRASALAQSNGELSVLAEFASIGSSITSPSTITSTATLNDTLTFTCTIITCTLGQNVGTGFLMATLHGGFLNDFEIGNNTTAFVSYTATISDPTQSFSTSGTTEFCPNPPATNCTVTGASIASPFTASIPFTLYSGDSYTVQIVMTAFVELVSGDTAGGQLLANLDDPLTLTLPTGIGFNSSSGQFAGETPEPSSWILMGSGLACLLWRRLAVKMWGRHSCRQPGFRPVS